MQLPRIRIIRPALKNLLGTFTFSQSNSGCRDGGGTLFDGYRNGIEHLFRRSQRFAQQASGLNAGRGLRVITGQAQEQFCALFGVAASK